MIDQKGERVWDITEEVNKKKKLGKKYKNNSSNGTAKNGRKISGDDKEKQQLRKSWMEILEAPQIFSDEEKEKFFPRDNLSIKALKQGIQTLIEKKDSREKELQYEHEEQYDEQTLPF